MEKRIYDLPDAPLPLNPNSYYEVLVPDGSSATGYTSCKIKPVNLDCVKRLKLNLVDNGSSDPTKKEYVNTLGTYSLSRVGAGHYQITSASLFTLDKTFIQVSATGVVNAPNITYYCTDASTIEIYARDSTNTLADGLLSEDNTYTSVLIEVYP